jgi:hypothetical protein
MRIFKHFLLILSIPAVFLFLSFAFFLYLSFSYFKNVFNIAFFYSLRMHGAIIPPSICLRGMALHSAQENFFLQNFGGKSWREALTQQTGKESDR